MSIQISSSLNVSGSLTVSNDIVGNLIGTSSFTLIAVTASYITSSAIVGSVPTSSYALTASYALNGSGGGSTTGSFTGSFTGSLQGSASYALTASYAMNSGGTGITNTGSFTGSFTGSVLGTASYATNALTSSYALTSLSSSYALTASFNFVTQSSVFTASYVSGSNVAGAVLSSSYALTASYALNGGGGGGVSSSYALTASFVAQALTAKNALTTGTFDTTQGMSGSLYITGGTIDVRNDVNTGGVKWNQILQVGSSTINPFYASSTVMESSSVGINTNRSLIFTANPNLTYIWNRAYDDTAQSLFKTTVDSASLFVQTSSISNQVTVTNREVYINANSLLLVGSRITSSGVIKGAIETASFVNGTVPSSFTASYVLTAQTASFVNIARTASWVAGTSVVGTVPSSFTASFVLTAQTASWVAGANVVGTVPSSFTASFVNIARTASFVQTAETASFVNIARTASFVQNALTASFISSFNYPSEIHVSTGSGNDTTGNGSISNPYQTIPRALGLAGTGSTIYIHPGSYAGSCTVSASAVNLVGLGPTRGSTSIGGFLFRNTDGITSEVSNLEVGNLSFGLTSSVDVQNCNIGTVSHTGAGFARIIGSTITGITITDTNIITSQTLVFIGSSLTSIEHRSRGTVWVQGCRFTGFSIPAGSVGTLHIDNSILNTDSTAAGGTVHISNTKFVQGNTSLTGGRFNFSNGTRYSLQNVVYDRDYSFFTGAVLTSSYEPSSTYFNAIGITSSLLGTASYATLAKNAETASLVLGSIASASFAFTASFVDTARTASFVVSAQTASFVNTARTASFVSGLNVVGTVRNAETASSVTPKSWLYMYKQALQATFTVSAGGSLTNTFFPTAAASESSTSRISYNSTNGQVTVQPGSYQLWFGLGQVTFPGGFTTTGFVNYSIDLNGLAGSSTRGHAMATGSNGNLWSVPFSSGIGSTTTARQIAVNFYGNCGSITAGGSINGSSFANGWQMRIIEL